MLLAENLHNIVLLYPNFYSINTDFILSFYFDFHITSHQFYKYMIPLMNSKKPIKNDKAIVGYYPDWASETLSPEKILFTKLMHINYAFAVVDENHELKLPSKYILENLIKLAHQHGVKVLLSIGGWIGSKHFSTLVKIEANRLRFIRKILALVKQISLDGIDIDWEYPGIIGLSSNEVDAISDTPNFIMLLKEMRALMKDKLLTML